MSYRQRGVFRFSRKSVRCAAAMTAGFSLLLVGACSTEETFTVDFVDKQPETTVLPAKNLTQASISASQTVFKSSDIAVVAADSVNSATLAALAKMSAEDHIPLLVGTGTPVQDELKRLGVSSVIADDEVAKTLGENTEVIPLTVSGEGVSASTSSEEGSAGAATATPSDAGSAGQNDTAGDLPAPVQASTPSHESAKASTVHVDAQVPAVTVDEEPPPVTVFVDPSSTPDAGTVVMANAEAASAKIVQMPHGDPRWNQETVEAAKQAKDSGIIALGESFGSVDTLSKRLDIARTVPQLPNGGQILFPSRRMVAAYGAPGMPSLGILGEQDIEGSIARVKKLAKQYAPYSDVPVVPAFEMIVTVASSSAGEDGDYSAEVDPELVNKWVNAAGEAGVYVVLDLQPGRTDFVTQAKMFEEQLRKPHVGLALDSEWRLGPGQKHLEQIGSVKASEVNATAKWLNDLTEKNELPEKVFMLHQFAHGMIENRENVDASFNKLAFVLHADGHGTPSLKKGTWEALQENLPEGIRMGWKNFYDEDTPTFTPKQTYEIEPRPWFVSYQ